MIFTTVGLVGTGAMGQGIAQIAAQAGATIKLFDLNPQAIEKAKASITSQWDKLAAKSKLTAEQVSTYSSRLVGCTDMAGLADCDLVVEAILEKLEVKQSVFGQLEAIVAPDAVLVSNTSSLSIDRKSTRLNSSHCTVSRMPSSA